MLVRANETCFVQGHRRRAGTVFDYAGTEEGLAPHLVPVKSDQAADEPPKIGRRQKPVALSEMGAANPISFMDAVKK